MQMQAETTALEGSRLVPVAIPETAPDRYISFRPALNIRLEDEHTGDWHFNDSFFRLANGHSPGGVLELAGREQETNSVPALGTKGIRDVRQILGMNRVVEPARRGPIWAANHFRAIVDLALQCVDIGHFPLRIPNYMINQFLDTEEEIETLRDEYAVPLAVMLESRRLELYQQWLATIRKVEHWDD